MNNSIASALKQLGAGITILSILLLGSLFYFTTGKHDVFFVSWFSDLAGQDFLPRVNKLIPWQIQKLSAVVVNSLPDGLWMAGMVLTMLWIWRFRLHAASVGWCLIAIAFGLVLEVLPLIHVTSGYFDINDLWMILGGGITPIFFNLLISRLWKKN
jgi:hypothetical protein